MCDQADIVSIQVSTKQLNETRQRFDWTRTVTEEILVQSSKHGQDCKLSFYLKTGLELVQNLDHKKCSK